MNKNNTYQLYKMANNRIVELVKKVTDNFTRIASVDKLKTDEFKDLYWGGNGIGDRFANKSVNYTSVYANGKVCLYSENDEDKIPEDLLAEFLQNKKRVSGIIGIFVHSLRTNTQSRPIQKQIHREITNRSCVVCGTQSTICDHKNDLYNDSRVLDKYTQLVTDFQPLCNHCNLQKRQVCKTELQTGIIYSAKNIERYRVYPFEFPWEKKAFDKSDIHCKEGTYWFDPVEFDRKIYYYSVYVIPVVGEIKRKSKLGQIGK